MDALPSIREELSRKALDALQDLAMKRATKAITEAQFATGLNVLWETVSGLVDKDFFEIISTIVVNKNDDSFRRRTFMLCREHWILTTVDVTALTVLVHRSGGSTLEILCESVTEALGKAEKIHQKAGLSGYTFIN
jgi:hypothetical protein